MWLFSAVPHLGTAFSPHCQIYKLFKDGQFEGNAQELSVDKHVYVSYPCNDGSHLLTESLLEKWLPLVPRRRVAYLREGAKANVSTRLFRLMEFDFPIEKYQRQEGAVSK